MVKVWHVALCIRSLNHGATVNMHTVLPRIRVPLDTDHVCVLELVVGVGYDGLKASVHLPLHAALVLRAEAPECPPRTPGPPEPTDRPEKTWKRTVSVVAITAGGFTGMGRGL